MCSGTSTHSCAYSTSPRLSVPLVRAYSLAASAMPSDHPARHPPVHQLFPKRSFCDPDCRSNPIAHRVRRKRQRLPPSLLIENASDRDPRSAPRVCPEAFPIKASDYTGVILEGRCFHTVVDCRRAGSVPLRLDLIQRHHAGLHVLVEVAVVHPGTGIVGNHVHGLHLGGADKDHVRPLARVQHHVAVPGSGAAARRGLPGARDAQRLSGSGHRSDKQGVAAHLPEAEIRGACAEVLRVLSLRRTPGFCIDR